MLVCFGGSDGKFEMARVLAALFCSRGLTAGGLLPGLVNAVVAVAPMSTVCQSFAKDKGISLMPGSSWSFHGTEAPYSSFGFAKFPLGRVVRKSLLASPAGFL